MKNLRFLLLTTCIFFFACQNNQSAKTTENSSNTEKITILEVIDGTTYSYLKGINNNKEIWVAIRKQPITVGAAYYYEQALEMKNFHSKELNQTFPSIYFLNSISDKALADDVQVSHSMNMKPSPKKIEVDLKQDDNFTSIKDVYQNNEKLSNSVIKVKGKVTKINKNILNKNWIHIQDGTVHNDKFDLTITTNQVVNIGEVVEFEGILKTNVDFGSGYKYDVILEQAKIINNTLIQ
jgi:hypothetical protein